MASTVCAPPGASPTVPVGHPGIDPVDVADAVLQVTQLAAIPVVTVAPAELGGCVACPPFAPVPLNPAGAVLVHREDDNPVSWRHRWPLCPQHLVTEARDLAARGVPTWVEVPQVVLP